MAERRRTRLTKSALRALQAAREAARRASRSSITPPADLARADAPAPSMPPVERMVPNPSSDLQPPSQPTVQSTPPRPRRGERRGERGERAVALRDGVGGRGRSAATPSAPLTSDEAELVELIDRLAVVADGSGLAEIEIAAGGTRVVVRSRGALATSGGPLIAAPASAATSVASSAPTPLPPEGSAAPKATAAAPTPSSSSAVFVDAPLTGVFYAARTPGGEPLVAVGQAVAVGQPIGLIEAMKLFNEIKSDRAGRIVRILAENGRLVKAKTPIIEVEPA